MWYLIIASILLAAAFLTYRFENNLKKERQSKAAPSQSEGERAGRDYRNEEYDSRRRGGGPSTSEIAAHFAKYAFVAFFLIFTAIRSMDQVPAGHVDVIRTFGAIDGQTSDGLVTLWPWQSKDRATVQVQGHKFEKLDSFSRESQNVFVAATLNIRISPQHIQGLYRTVGKDYFDILVAPRVRQAFKDETVKYLSVDIAPHREDIRRDVRERLTRELRANSIIVEDLLIDDIAFSPQFQAAIESKQARTQKALEELAGVDVARNQAQQSIQAAIGEAQANERLNASITPQLIRYLTISKLAPNAKVIVVPSGQSLILDANR